jgi:hypothetical protein
MTTSPTRVTVVRSATKRGSNASAWSAPSASTVHQTSWPPQRHDASAGRWRSGVSWPRKAA